MRQTRIWFGGGRARSRLVAVVLCCVVGAVVTSGIATAGASKNVVNGSVSVPLGSLTFTETFDAQTLSASTTSARGSFSAVSSDGRTWSGTIDTLLVSGNAATACGTITASPFPNQVGLPLQVFVADNGNGLSGTPDAIDWGAFDPSIPCLTPSPDNAVIPVSGGNLSVYSPSTAG